MRMPLYTACYAWWRNQTRCLVRMWHFIVECCCVNHHIFSIEGEGEAIQAPWRRTVQEFTSHIIMRAVTGAFEADAIIPEWDRTPQVNAALVQRDPIRTVAIFHDRFCIQLV